LPGISYEALAKGITEASESMDPRCWLQSIMHSLLGANTTFIAYLVSFCIGYSCLLSPMTIKILQNFWSHVDAGIATFKK
jgi:hypothetical protein